MTRRPSAIRRLRDVGRSIRSSFSSSMALSPTAWVGPGQFVRRYSERAHGQRRLRALNAEEGQRRAPHNQEALRRKAALGLALRAVIGVLLVTALIAAFRMLIPSLPMPDVCRSHSCVEYSERLRRSLNLSVSPCDSLEAFVCSGWNAHNILSKRLNLLDTALARLSRLVRSGSRVATGPQNTEQRGAAFFRSCDAVLRGERDEALGVMKALDEAHVSWPGRTPRQRQPDALRTLLFTAIRLGWAAILRVDILGGNKVSIDGAAPRGQQADSVVLRPSREFGMLARKYVSQRASPAARRAYVNLLSQELGTGHNNNSSAATFDATQRLDADFLAPLVNTLGTGRPRPTVTVEGSALFSGRRAIEDRWRNALAEFGVRAGHRLRSEYGDFVRTFLDLWESRGEDSTHLFVSWCTIQVAALFASRRLVVSFYECDMHGPVVQGLHCLARAYLLSGFALFAGYSAELLHGDARTHADAIVRAVRREFRKTLTDDNATAVVDWSSTDVVFRAVDATTRERADDGGGVQPGYPYLGDSLVDNWRRVADAQPVALSSREEVSVASAIEWFSLYAIVERDLLLLPYAFSFPLYDEDAAHAISYVGLGCQVAMALGELFLEAQPDSLPQGLHCIVPNSTKVHQVERQALQVLSTNVVFDAYKSTAQASDKRLVGFERLTLPQLFFVAACYAMCPGVPSTARFIAGLTSDVSGAEPGCDAVFSRARHFARTFGCAPRATKSEDAECSALEAQN